MTRNRKNSGFTLAEVLIVVAITVILMGVAFVGVQSYQRSSTRLEFDGIAKEIFIAAQNHLTAAESQGYLKIENNQFGHLGTLSDSEKEDIYYILASDTESEIKNLMLPNYALDSMAMGGSYIIRYQPSSATVLDVFYSRPGRSSLLTVTGKTLTEADYPTLMSDTVNYRKGGEKNRENYNKENVVVGWYGGAEAVPRGIRLQAPSFEVINAEKLHVKVTDRTLKKYLDYFEDAFLFAKADRYDVRGKRHLEYPKKYYATDVGLRNARLNFRQIDEPHLMENVIYNELVARGYGVDVGVVELRRRKDGESTLSHLEIDFVVNTGMRKVYVQSAFRMADEEKRRQETASLRASGDFFRKIVVVSGTRPPLSDDDGIVYVGVIPFLLDPSILEGDTIG